MDRKHRRTLGKRLNKMSATERMDSFSRAVEIMATDVVDICLTVLKEEFGFGQKRLDRFTEAVAQRRGRSGTDTEGDAVNR